MILFLDAIRMLWADLLIAFSQACYRWATA
jgi:hypothetical protein